VFSGAHFGKSPCFWPKTPRKNQLKAQRRIQASAPQAISRHARGGCNSRGGWKKKLRTQNRGRKAAAGRGTKRLTTLKQEIDVKLARLEKIQDVIQTKLDEQKALGDERIKHLIKIYTTMPPKKAAGLIEKLDMNVIISLFSSMKGENVGQILPYVSTEKAAAISERLAKQGL